MNFKQVLGLLLAILGVASLFVAHSIDARLDEGREQISSAESQVGQGRRLFSGSPATRDVGNALLFNPADRKINAAKGEVDQYALLATQLRIGGVVLIVAGIGVIYFFRKK